MLRKIAFILAFAILLTLFTGCGKKEELKFISVGNESDATAGYEKETVIPIEGEEDGMLVKEAKYNYKSGNVMILNVKNQTAKDYTVTINGTFKDAKGKELKSMTKTFEGFAAEFQNYFVFDPEIAFNSFSYTLTTEPYKGTVFVKYVTQAEGNLELTQRKSLTDNNIKPLDKPAVMLCVEYPQLVSTYSATLYHSVDLVLFDNKGDIYWIGARGGNITNEKQHSPGARDMHRVVVTDTSWDERNKYELPEELRGDVTGIVALNYVNNVFPG